MTFDSRFCKDVFHTLGRDDTLRHAYRVYVWRRALGFVYHSPSDDTATAGAALCSLIQTSIPPSEMLNGLNAERARSSWRM